MESNKFFFRGSGGTTKKRPKGNSEKWAFFFFALKFSRCWYQQIESFPNRMFFVKMFVLLFGLVLSAFSCTPRETNSSHLKMDGWNTIVSFWGPAHFRVRTVSFTEGIFLGFFLVLKKLGQPINPGDLPEIPSPELRWVEFGDLNTHVIFTPWKINGWNLQITHLERKMIF